MQAHPRKWHRRQRAAGACALVLVLQVAGACGSSGSDTGAPATDSSLDSTTTVPAPTDVEQAVLAAYQEFWRVWLRANNPPNPDYPDLAKVATGAELETVRTAIRKKILDGTYTRLPEGSHYRHRPALEKMTEAGASVRDCAVDDSQIVDAAGHLVNDDVLTQLLISTVTRSGESWQVVSVHEQQQWLGDVECE